jgi:pimeloyl-ACP methyl ester carboxylesterase
MLVLTWIGLEFQTLKNLTILLVREHLPHKPWVCVCCPTPLPGSLSLPTWTIRALLVGVEAPIELCRAIQAAVRIVSAKVLALRLNELKECDATEALLKCSVPIFYLHGTEDRLLGKHALQSLLAARSDMTVIDVPGPHMLLQAAPDACARHIEAAVGNLDWHER